MIAKCDRKLPIIGHFFEAPRWHDGRWWVSDMVARSVQSVAPSGDARLEFQTDDRPSGLGWMPDGALIVVAMDTRTLLRCAPGESSLRCFADLSQVCLAVSGHLNDLVIDPVGNIYVGFDPDFTRHGFRSEFGSIIHVGPQGNARVAASGLHFPNGMLVSGDGARLVIAETGTPRLTEFTIGPVGTISQRSVWGLVDAPEKPAVRWGETGLDGCAIDAEGCIWVANSGSSDCLRLRPGGEIVDIVRLPPTYRCLACALGGVDGRTLLICGFELAPDYDLARSTSHLFIADVAVGAAI